MIFIRPINIFYGKVMKKRRIIDRQRESALTLEVGGEDGSPITDLLSTKDGLYVLKANGVYQVKLADDIDPERTNPDIPTLSQQVISAGTDHPIISTILLTTKYLFDTNNSQVDEFVAELFDYAISLTKKLIDIDQSIEKIIADTDKERVSFSAKELSPRNFSIPSVAGLDSRVHEIFMNTNKIREVIIESIKLTFEQGHSQIRLDQLSSVAKEAMQGEPQLVRGIEEIFQFLTLIRNIRNASEHPKKENRLIVTNFSLQPTGVLDSPLIELQHPTTPMNRSPLSDFLRGFIAVLVENIEITLAILKFARLMKHNPFGETVAEFSFEQRRHPNVRFYRAIHFGGELRILG
jgi:hypothetical protein